MKKLTLCLIALALLLPAAALAQSGITANGQLTITANVQSSIALTFKDGGQGTLTVNGADPTQATIALGNVSGAMTSSSTNATVTTSGGNLVITSPFVLSVTGTNTPTTDYKLVASASAPVGTEKIFFGATEITTSGTTFNTVTYGDTTYSLNLQVPLSQGPGAITRTVALTATTN